MGGECVHIVSTIVIVCHCFSFRDYMFLVWLSTKWIYIKQTDDVWWYGTIKHDIVCYVLLQLFYRVVWLLWIIIYI